MATITIRGRQYPALFDLQNVEELQKHYENGLEGIADAIQQNNVKEIAYVAWLLIREGVELDNEEHHRDNVPPTQKMLEKLIGWPDLVGEHSISAAVQQAFYEFFGKNAQSRDLMEQGMQQIQQRLSGSPTSNPGGSQTTGR